MLAAYDTSTCEVTMNKLESPLQTPTFVIDCISDSGHDPDRRLIVLIPAASDYTAATRRVWELANSLGARVELLGLCQDEEQEQGLRRQLVTMASLLQDGRVITEFKVEFGTNWVRAVKRNYQSGTIVVCFAEQCTGLLHRPLSQILQSNLNVPLYILSGLHPQNLPQLNWLSQIMAWSGLLGIISGSFLLQVRITSLPPDWAQTTLMILSVIGEIWFIWGWNNLFR
jgi:hypothetical protein